MISRYVLTAAIAILSLAAADLAVAQTSSQQQNAQNPGSQAERSQNTTSPRRGSSANSRQTAQAPFDPWHAKGHELDNIADKLNACMLHPPAAQQACIDEAIRHP